MVSHLRLKCLSCGIRHKTIAAYMERRCCAKIMVFINDKSKVFLYPPFAYTESESDIPL